MGDLIGAGLILATLLLVIWVIVWAHSDSLNDFPPEDINADWRDNEDD